MKRKRMRMIARTIVALALLRAPSLLSAAAPICDSTTALTLLGIDTAAGRLLFTVPSPGSAPPWIVELDAQGRAARAHSGAPPGLYAGSVGPGPVVAANPCGAGCVQPMRWSGDGRWEPLGEPLSLPSVATVTPTWDGTGTPWIVAHGAAGADGRVPAWAFRLEGREWRGRGTLPVAALGEPRVQPAPHRKDGVITGTGLFSASGSPETWVAGLPDLPPERRGQVIPLAGAAAAYLSSDGVVYLSEDSGRTWRRSTWTPWASTGTTGLWRQGRDFWVDLPAGDHRGGALRLAWFDRRRPSEEVVLLTRLRHPGDWQRLAEAPAEVRTRNESLPISQVLAPRGDAWILLSGCVHTRDGSSLVVRGFDGTALSAPRLVGIGGER